MANEVVQTSFGKFQVDDRDLIEATIKAGTVWDGPGFLQVIAMGWTDICRFDAPRTTILDVGANVGAFTIWLAHQHAFRVVAVEPIRSTYVRLLANLDLNKDRCATRVITIPVAAYSRSTYLELAASIDPHNSGEATLVPTGAPSDTLIQAEPLDTYLPLYGEKVSLIKIDAQGCDFHALQGLETTIALHRPAIVFEWDPKRAVAHNVNWNDVAQFLNRLCYSCVRWPSHPDNFLAVPLR